MSDEHEAFRERLDSEVLKLTREIYGQREKLVTAWIAETGLLPSESMIIEERDYAGDAKVKISIVRKEAWKRFELLERLHKAANRLLLVSNKGTRIGARASPLEVDMAWNEFVDLMRELR